MPLLLTSGVLVVVRRNCGGFCNGSIGDLLLNILHEVFLFGLPGKTKVLDLGLKR